MLSSRDAGVRMSLPVLSHFWSPTFIRFLCVGALNTVFGYSIYAMVLWLGAHFAFATLTSTVLGVCFNYCTTGALVFSTRDRRFFGRFIAAYGVAYLVQVTILWGLTKIGIGPYLAGAILVPVMAVFTFLLMKLVVFREDHLTPEGSEVMSGAV